MSKDSAKPMPLVLISGLSGSGKSTALDVFEDLGFFKMDGVPPTLLLLIIDNLSRTAQGYSGMVLGVDLREAAFVEQFPHCLTALKASGYAPSLIFFEALESVLVNRYASTRRPHPLEKKGGGLDRAMELERESLQLVRNLADMVVDTSDYSIHALRRSLQHKWKSLQKNTSPILRLHIISFGFKYGTPSEADMIFDLRFLPNPHFDETLRPLSGLDAPVADYVLKSEAGEQFFHKLVDFLTFTLDLMEKEGRYRLTLGIGCTGGRHRSVAVAEALANLLSQKYTLSLEHRHLELG